MWGDPIGAATLNQPIPSSSDDSQKTASAPYKRNKNNSPPPPPPPTELTPTQNKCISSLYQITGPAHIPTTDIRWQELFLSYDLLVHLDRGQHGNGSHHTHKNGTGSTSAAPTPPPSPPPLMLMDQICHSMAKHARNSSNLAAYAWHLTKMMNEFMASCKECMVNDIIIDGRPKSSRKKGQVSSSSTSSITNNSMSTGSRSSSKKNLNVNATTAKITMVGKARVVCGALNLFRILCHEVITTSVQEENNDSFTSPSSSTQPPSTNTTSTTSYEYLQEAFTYKSRQKDCAGLDIDTSTQLLSTLLSFVSMVGNGKQGNYRDIGNSSPSPPSSSSLGLLKTVPELYDATVLTLMLLTVFFSTQLYHPLLSSFELRDEICANAKQNKQQQQHHLGTTTTTTRTSKAIKYNFTIQKNFFIDKIMILAYENRQKQNTTYQQKDNRSQHTWSSQSILTSCFTWMIERPNPPERSIAAHFRDMVEIIANDIKGEKIGADGMYENHAVVMARAPLFGNNDGNGDGKGGSGSGDKNGSSQHGGSSRGVSGGGHGSSGGKKGDFRRNRSAPKVIMDATNTVIHISSSLLLLPFRLMSLALRALGHPQQYLLGGGSKASGGGFDDAKLSQLQAAYGARGGSNSSIASPTNDVLWLSDSPVADLGCSLFLILANNYRASNSLTDTSSSYAENGSSSGTGGDSNAADCFVSNAFRSELAALDDNRWDGWDNSYSANNHSNGQMEAAVNTFESVDLNENETNSLLQSSSHPQKQKRLLTTNFEHLFQSFGRTLHNELGALTLYTLLQSSPIFAASIAVRSDLDMLVLPLLRTLYFSSSANQHIAGRTTTSTATTAPSGEKISKISSVTVAENPFRSQSQLYVIMILLLIFSQDTSFGPDSFRRSNIPLVLWYKERNLKNISLGSLLVLSLLRCITYNLNRMQDPFLLSNCCAVLLNLSPHIANLHSYASMRLASVLVSTMKRYTVLIMKNGGRPADEGDVSSLLGMYAETCRILIQVVKHCIRRKVVDKNLHIVYALVYHQRDFNTVLKAKRSPFRPAETEKITAIIQKADALISNASARTAEKTLEILQKSTDALKGKSSKSRSSRMISSGASVTDDSTISTASSSTVSGMEDFRFTYEEEADPEIFFVPYMWEVLVCCVSSSTLEWNKNEIKVFALMEHMMDDTDGIEQVAESQDVGTGMYAKDVADVV